MRLLLAVFATHAMAMAFAEGKAFNIVAENNGSYTAANIPGGLEARIDQQGFALFNEHGVALSHFRVKGVGRLHGTLLPNVSGAPQPSPNELYFPGDRLAVHYQHSADGLRQNFIVFGSPDGTGALDVAMDLTGPATPSLLNEEGLRFRDEQGVVRFDYRGLRCWDALGTELRAHFELEARDGDHRLHIVVDDEHARYPITIDPVSTSPNTLLIGTGTAWEFGIAVATAGDLNGDGRSDVVVGAWQATMGQNLEGVAYVYYGTNTGISTTASVILQGEQNGAQMGNAVSTAGDVNGDGYSDLLVGVRTWESDNVNELSEGAVFVYYGSATGIGTTPNIILQPNHPDDNFGSNVACAGDINNDGYSDVLVGAYLSSYPSLNEGAVFVYTGGPGGLTNTALHRLERNQGGGFFGRSVAGAGDVNGDGYSDVIVGASKFVYTAGASDQGSAFVYYGGASGLGAVFNPAPSLQLYGTGNNVAYYGWAVTCAGDLNGDGYSDVAVSAYNDRIGAETSEGLVYVYHGGAAGLNSAAVAVLQSNQANAWMGRSLSSAGDVNGDGYADLMVGAPKYSSPESLEGAGMVYFGSPAGIATTPSLTLEVNEPGANAGESVCTAGDVNGDGWSDMIVGARIYGISGAAAVFHGGGFSTSLTASSSRFGGMTNALLGASSANAGDVNGDGYSDVIVGAPGASSGEAGEGLVYVHYGSTSGLPVPPSLVLQANVAAAQFGASVSSAGDVNGDGYADVMVGAPMNGSGLVYIYMGGAGGLSVSPSLTLSGGTQFGASIAPAGDVNTDGFGDVIIGAPGSGQAFIYHGSAMGLSTTPALVLAEVQPGSLYGCSVNTAGDVNGDGYSDVIVGARGWSNGQTGEGVAFVYHGGDVGVVTPYARMLEVNQAGANFGVSVSGAGDVNGDGFFDVVVGADLWESGQTDEGAIFMYHGTASGVPAAAATTLQRNVGNGRMGCSVAEAGDVNGDGYADVVAGAYLSENNGATTDEGMAYVYRGGPTGILAAAYDQLEPNLANYRFGRAVCGGGDVDGDGYSDVIVGATGAAPALTNEGGMYWYRGCVARALNRFTRQYNTDLVTPMSTNSEDLSNLLPFFGVGHRTRNPIQRCKARLRWELANEGSPWSGTPITNSVSQSGIQLTWTTLPVNGSEIKQLVPKTGMWLRYKWRVREEYDLAKLIDGQRFSRWFYGYASAVGDIGVLPVELISFSGKANGEANDLFWSTATEHNTDRFEVQRSTDGDDFITIGSVNAAGYSINELNYLFTDAAPPQGLVYYRLRMVDQDGAEEWSGTIMIARIGGIAAVHPNPADDLVGVLIANGNSGAVLCLMDPQGRIVRTVMLPEGEGSMDLMIDIGDLAAGAYTLVLRDRSGSVQAASQLIVQ